MTARRGASLPRLQEFAFLEVALAGVVANQSYEEIRRRLIGYMQSIRETDRLGGNTAKFQLERPVARAYADNVTEALKELMRLGLVERAKLPSGGPTIRHYDGTTFAPSPAGAEFADLARQDWRAARDRLLGLMQTVHPQLAGYFRILESGGLVIPLANWGELRQPRSRTGYLELLASRAADVLRTERAGWKATAAEITDYVRDYVDLRVAAAAKRGKPDPFARNEDFVRQCEKAMVRLAFDRAGSPTDYISHEVVRRWLRDLEVAAFSYHVPGPIALRIWKTADFTGGEEAFTIRRHQGEEFLDAVVRGLGEGYETVRATGTGDIPWIQIYRLRAAVCYRLKVSEQTFDTAVNDILHERRGIELPFKVNVEFYEFGSTPPSERPLRIRTNRGERDVHTLALIPRITEVTA
jgi:hypothetical protein